MDFVFFVWLVVGWFGWFLIHHLTLIPASYHFRSATVASRGFQFIVPIVELIVTITLFLHIIRKQFLV